ncbi:hypothetical protein N7447_008235 [Penicillium robsamsonii]|uniref:uncharacterized protein n=1 Tax=Penicillium robsamsonii TaxID=1792511 RepID=UPI002548E91C|nr:uncharacterized protein N7447_008235 [Penicillium robsamsonii]KAJ5816002.1 hypothetical protein N7447_008235 [Penicillium robsamsonii]
MKRRQNHSCEQCRKAKKACDGYLQNSGNAVFMEAELLHLGIQGGLISPCSYCIKTNKICGLNPHWGQGHHSTDGQSFSRSENIGLDERRRDKRQRIHLPENEIETSVTPISMMTCQNSSKETLHVPLPENSVVGWDAISAPVASLPIGHPNLVGALAGYENCSHPGDSRQVNDIAISDDQHVDRLEYNSLDSLMELETAGSVSDDSRHFDFNSHSVIPDTSQTSLYNHNNPAGSISSEWDETDQSELWRWQKRRKDFSNSQDYFLVPLSLFGAGHIAMENSNRLLISESLLQIYHDVLENNLSCWLAEDTCPYKMQQRRHEHLSIRQSRILGGQITPEWGVSWSNRMYHRIKQLDRSAQLTKLIHLTASENRAASKALELSIMTFATQWAQGGRRWDGHWLVNKEEGLHDEFGQTLHRSVWECANQALQDVSEVECFRVVFAELIFGLIQKPSSNNYSDARTKERQTTADLNSTFSRVMNIIDQAGPPVFMERGARKIHALKHRFKARQAGFHSLEIEEQVSHEFSTEETRTVGLLYWLAIMFDTVSSSMNERPVVVSDEECQHEAAQKAVQNHIQSQISSSRWELDLYAQEDSEKPLALRWPLPYEVVTRAVSRSAAVKVLLFRYISYLQKSLRNSERSQAVEEIIQHTLTVYRYWLKTHGALFRDLMGHYDSVPPRIKSWFPCIGIPWHLGSLMLADLIEFVDMHRLGCKNAMVERQNTCLVMKIRKESSIDLADLAVVLTPRPFGGLGLNQLPGFHFAVNESPLLTEPWTVLLVRAFSKASIFHLKETEKLQKYQRFVFDHESRALQASITRLENCVIALRFLGAKSGMAEAISIVLSESLNKCRN